MMDDRISWRQQQFLDFMKRFEKRHGKPPTFKEIAIGMGISSKGSVSAMMATLEQMGQIDRAHGAYRGTVLRRPVQKAKL
jgi:SOS-response transcriptional repressor LexA